VKPDGTVALGFWTGNQDETSHSHNSKDRKLVDLVGPCSNVSALDATEYSWNSAIPVTDLPLHALGSFMADHDSSLVRGLTLCHAFHSCFFAFKQANMDVTQSALAFADCGELHKYGFFLYEAWSILFLTVPLSRPIGTQPKSELAV
jgi:hypothetical protein